MPYFNGKNDFVLVKSKLVQLKPEFAQSLADMTDQTKMYVYEGNIWAFMSKEVPEVTIPNFDNQIKLVGYEDGKISSSGGGLTTASGIRATGYIPIGQGEGAYNDRGEWIIHLNNIAVTPSTDGNTRIALYDADKAYIGLVSNPSFVSAENDSGSGVPVYTVGADGFISTIDFTGFRYNHQNNKGQIAAFIRFCAPGIDSNSILTINEPIEYITTGGESVNGWTDTGFAFVPANYEDRIRKEEALSAHFASEIESIKEQLAEDNGEIVVPNSTHTFIVEEAERVAKDVQSARTAKSLVFPVMSDMHLFDGNTSETHKNSLISAQYAGMGVAELKKRMHFDFIAYLGDITWGASDHTVEQVKNDITAFKQTTDTAGTEIWCVGNHDVNYGKNRDRLLTLDEQYGYIGANSDGVKPYANIERCYGYKDFDNQKTRVIYLNTCDASDWEATAGENARSEWISPTQIQWLASTALNFTDKAIPSEWGIVIVGHHPLHYDISCFESVMKLLEAYRDGIDGSLSCKKNTSTNETVTYTFSNTERAEIICNIHGHAHNCAFSKISSTTRTGSTEVTPWLWRFCIPNICAGRYNSGYDNFTSNPTAQQNYGEVDENGNCVEWTKETGTAKATSFCVVNIDRKNRKIYAHIFGAGTDREISY